MTWFRAVEDGPLCLSTGQDIMMTNFQVNEAVEDFDRISSVAECNSFISLGFRRRKKLTRSHASVGFLYELYWSSRRARRFWSAHVK